jgi:hypothetical protein
MAKVVKKTRIKKPVMVARLTGELLVISSWLERLREILEQTGETCEVVLTREQMEPRPFPGGFGPGPGASKCGQPEFRAADRYYACDLADVTGSLGVWTKSIAQELAKFPGGTKVPPRGPGSTLRGRTAAPRARTRTRVTGPRARKPKRK